MISSLKCYLLIILFSFCSTFYHEVSTSENYSTSNQFCDGIYDEFVDINDFTNDNISIYVNKHICSTILISVLARNSAHLLPIFFGFIEQQNYPKDRIAWWIQTDHNIDNTSAVLKQWAENSRKYYHSVELFISINQSIHDQTGEWDWSTQRHSHVAMYKQEALNYAKKIWSDYILFLDTDVFLCEPNLLYHLVKARKQIIGPLLSIGIDTLFTNFWGDVSDVGYYKRSDNYIDIVERTLKGVFKVSLVHSAILLDLKNPNVRNMQYWPPVETYYDTYNSVDDMLILMTSAVEHDVDFHVINYLPYGFMMEYKNYASLEEARQVFLDFAVENLAYFHPIPHSNFITSISSLVDDAPLPLDKVFMVNLERRPDRRERMFAILKLLNIKFNWFKAIDGRKLNETFLNSLNIKMLPGWRDPWGSRAITYGEIGCFLSHYFIWQDMVKYNFTQILILEDDIRFHENFRNNLIKIIEDLQYLEMPWDLVYIGRKRLAGHHHKEHYVDGSAILVKPDYTYWTLGYLVSRSGADKLLNQKPLQKIVALDEYLPIMYNKHPRLDWSSSFEPRDLIAFSAEPLLIEPTHYAGEKGYFSDTEPTKKL